MTIAKHALQFSFGQAVIAALLLVVLKLLWFTFRRKVQCHPDAAPFMRGEQPAIFCFWHGRMFIFPFYKPKKRPLHVLISQHRDGELIARVIAYFGISSVRGSTSKGAAEATKSLLSALRSGGNIAITPDGPRGPAFTVQRGALHLARLSGAPLVPVHFSASSFTTLRSWDGFILPHPFASLHIDIGAPIAVAQTATLGDLAALKAQLAAALNNEQPQP